MKKHTRNTRLTRGERQQPPWLGDVVPERPKWNCVTPADEASFKRFVFAELDRREWAEMNAMATEASRPENTAMFLEMIEDGWRPPDREPRMRGRPKVDPIVRRHEDGEYGARLVRCIREIFEDYWDKWNRQRPTAEEIASEYTSIRLKLIMTRLKRSHSRRPD